MIDEVIDISLIEPLVSCIQYVDTAGCSKIQFLFTADLLKTIVKEIKVTESRDRHK